MSGPYEARLLERIAYLEAERHRLRQQLGAERRVAYRQHKDILRLLRTLDEIADPEYHDADWRAMRQLAQEALEVTE